MPEFKNMEEMLYEWFLNQGERKCDIIEPKFFHKFFRLNTQRKVRIHLMPVNAGLKSLNDDMEYDI